MCTAEALLETYTFEELLEMNDLTEEEVLVLLIKAGLINTQVVTVL